jgi:hypothetical protein
MFCTHCGNEVEQQARFCSKCGQEVTAASRTAVPAPIQTKPRDMSMHINILGWLLIGSGVLTGIGSLFVLFIGQIFRHGPFPMPPDMPPGMPHFIGWISSLVGLFLAAVAAGTAAAGVGLLQYRDWARTLTIIMAVLLLFHFPIGTGVAIYAFWVLFSKEGQDHFRTQAGQTS